jgi:hypothetical protein
MQSLSDEGKGGGELHAAFARRQTQALVNGYSYLSRQAQALDHSYSYLSRQAQALDHGNGYPGHHPVL